MIRAASLLLSAWLAVQCAAVFAQQPGRTGLRPLAGTPSRPMVEQKHALVARLLGDSTVTGRVDKSGNADARDFLARAVELYGQGRKAEQAGNLGAADAAFNDAIWLIGRARQLVPDAAYRVSEQRSRYDQLVSTLDALQQSYRLHLSRLGRTEAGDAGWNAVSQLVERARALRASDRPGEANLALLQAEQRLLEAFGGMLSGSTIDYTPRFADPAEEFRFELERNRGYRELVPIALSELKPAGDAASRVALHVESDRLLSGKARELAEQRSYAEALSTIRASTLSLQRALREAGLVVPQDDGAGAGGGGS